MQTQKTAALLRLPAVLARVPVCKTTWWAGVKSGRYPAPMKLSPRVVAWREEDIDALVAGGVADPAALDKPSRKAAIRAGAEVPA
jgi:prophage regulatory protein